MGLVNVVFSAAGQCLDAVCLLLDLNFIVVHTVVRTLLAVVTFIHSLPSLLLASVLELQNLLLCCLVSVEEAAESVAHGAVVKLGSVALALEGLLESLKMVGYLSVHVVLRGKEQLCRGVLSMWEGCGIALSLVLYLTNTVVNYVLIATQNVYLAVVSAWQTVFSPLLKVLELTLTSITFLYSSLVGTSALLWSPCKLALDFTVSLLHMFISVFILNVYGLALTLAIALTTTAYLNPELTRHSAARILDYLHSALGLRRLRFALRRLSASAWSVPLVLRGNARRLPRIFHHLYVLERRLWRQLSRHSSQIGLALRTYLQRHDGRVRGDGDHGEDRRGPPDGRAGDGAHVLLASSSSTDRPLKRASSSGSEAKPLPADDLLTLLKEQEDRKKCVICQDSAKTVVLLPCRHLCLCRDCTNILLRQPIYQQNCPLCRHMILNTMDVYL